jgi:hypothetical protein
MKLIRAPFLLLLLVATTWSAPSARAAALICAPAETTVAVGDEFVLRVQLDAVPNFKGCDLVYGHSLQLTFLEATAGDVITSGGAVYVDFLLPDAVAPADSVWYDAVRLTGIGTGPGVVVSFKFHASAEGDAIVSCLSTDLRDSSNQPLAPSCVGALVHVLGPTPARPLSWGRVKAFYR